MAPLLSRLGVGRSGFGFGKKSGSALPTFAVSPSTASVNEGSSVTFTVTTTNVSDGTTLYWSLNTVSGTVNTSDFTGAAVTGSFSISSNTGSVALTLANDITTEGSESFQLQVRTGSTSGTIVATSSTVTIADTSVETYSVSPSTASVNEGSSVTFTVTTAGVPNGTTLYWTTNTVSGTINTSDFSDAAVSGSFTITSNSGSVVRTLANDVTTEGSESFQLQVRTGSTSGTIVATSSTVTIGDTSLTCASLSLSAFSTLCSPAIGTHSRNSTARSDPNASYLILNIPFWGPNGNTSTSEGIADIHATVKGSGTNLTLTNNSGLSISTSQYKYYGASASFNYSNLDTPALSGLNGAMTFECWWRHGGGSPGFGDQSGTIWNSNPGGSYSGPGMGYSKGGTFYMSGCDIDSTVFNPSVGTWYHLAFARTGTGGGHTSRFFVNGVLYRYGTNDTTNHSTVWRFGISNGGYTYGSIGYMQDVRVYSGLCKYTSDFTITGP